MSINCVEERTDLPSEICKHCNHTSYDYYGYDAADERADLGILVCELDEPCLLSTIDWPNFISEMEKIHD